mmetsp:Transcript_17004/g.48419  ORF Transcript_17004/g.48419 Transcript_17004/m.48419 type:complete len:310 (+) Transcript_17004:100-1029(+)
MLAIGPSRPGEEGAALPPPSPARVAGQAADGRHERPRALLGRRAALLDVAHYGVEEVLRVTPLVPEELGPLPPRERQDSPGVQARRQVVDGLVGEVFPPDAVLREGVCSNHALELVLVDHVEACVVWVLEDHGILAQATENGLVQEALVRALPAVRERDADLPVARTVEAGKVAVVPAVVQEDRAVPEDERGRVRDQGVPVRVSPAFQDGRAVMQKLPRAIQGLRVGDPNPALKLIRVVELARVVAVLQQFLALGPRHRLPDVIQQVRAIRSSGDRRVVGERGEDLPPELVRAAGRPGHGVVDHRVPFP